MGPSREEGEAIAVVDTSFLIALLHETDRFHKDAVQNLPRGDRLLVPWEVWVEFLDVMGRVLPADDLKAVGRSILAGPFQIQRVLAEEDLLDLAARGRGLLAGRRLPAGRSLSLFDLVVCGVAERFREAILTFDAGIASAVRARLFPGARLA